MGNCIHIIDKNKILLNNNETRETYALICVNVTEYTEKQIFSALKKEDDWIYQLEIHGSKIRAYIRHLIKREKHLNEVTYIRVYTGKVPLIKIKNTFANAYRNERSKGINTFTGITYIELKL
jgi:hypothetical protein